MKKSYVYTPTSQILYQRDHTQSTSDDEFFYVHDRLGSVRLVVDENETTKNSYTYDPTGVDFATEVTESAENPFKFTGQWYDDEISQYYLRARMYDPQLMRFTGYDPVRGRFGHPLTLHRYLYCNNDSINRIDPDGEFYVLVAKMLIGGALNGVSAYTSGANGKEIAVASMIGALSAAIPGKFLGTVASALLPGIGAGATSYLAGASGEEIARNIIFSSVSGVVGARLGVGGDMVTDGLDLFLSGFSGVLGSTSASLFSWSYMAGEHALSGSSMYQSD